MVVHDAAHHLVAGHAPNTTDDLRRVAGHH